ncbi:MAG TPA: rhodanese-like domain-containing protein [Opitutaceae bacterium]|nr:rhodanese-like domain-containing protein [Opitutaceae bacterium]
MSFPAEVDVATAARLHAGGALLVDVREPHEWEFVHVAGSRHIPLRRLPESVADLPRDRDLLLLCHVGGRSARATQFLRAHGFDRAANVAGGIDAWAEQVDPTLARY